MIYIVLLIMSLTVVISNIWSFRSLMSRAWQYRCLEVTQRSSLDVTQVADWRFIPFTPLVLLLGPELVFIRFLRRWGKVNLFPWGSKVSSLYSFQEPPSLTTIYMKVTQMSSVTYVEFDICHSLTYVTEWHMPLNDICQIWCMSLIDICQIWHMSIPDS